MVVSSFPCIFRSLASILVSIIKPEKVWGTMHVVEYRYFPCINIILFVSDITNLEVKFCIKASICYDEIAPNAVSRHFNVEGNFRISHLS